jgi:hypothetical protein
MQFPSRYALLVLGPLSIWSTGCSSVTHRPISQSAAISQTDRLLGMAQVYEQKGQYEQAHKLYCQVLQQDPNHALAREHATDLLAAMANARGAKDAAADEQLAQSGTANSKLNVASVAPAPTDPALLGKSGRKVLSDEEVAARIPKPRHAREPQTQVATVTHEQAKSPRVTPAEQLTEQASPMLVLEAPLTVVEPQPVELPVITAVPLEPTQEVVSSPVIEAQPAVVSAPAVISVQSAPATTWVKTSIARLCPSAPSEVHDRLAALDSTDRDIRKSAIEELATCGSAAETCIPAFRACLNDSDALVQAHAAWAIWTVSGESQTALRTLCQVLYEQDEEAVIFACYVLGDMGSAARSAVATLTHLQDDDSTGIRVHASEALLKIQPETATSIRVLTASLSSHRADERSLAAVALGAAQGSQRSAALSALITALYDSDAGVRSSAALAIGGFAAEGKAAISALEVAAAATDNETREAALTALACIRK